ncbi:MAG: DUF3795 domain-containing protein [Bacillota bacterium]
MDKIIAYCGLCCTSCPAYLVTKYDDQEKRIIFAQEWSTEKYPLKPEDINCDGCIRKDGSIIVFCRECDIRECAMSKGVQNCAYCNEYSCEKLEMHFEKSPESRDLLDNLKKMLKE